MPWIVRQIRNAAPLSLIILLGILSQKWWQPYLTNAQSIQTQPPSSTKESKSDDDDNDVKPTTQRGQKIAFQPTELTSLESKTLTPLPDETPPPKEDMPFLPNRKKTPGAILTQATRQIICVPGYSKKVRNVPVALKKQGYNNYGIKHHEKGEYEMDHLIPLELGGSNDITNLWPQPYHGFMSAREKDKLENEMHHRVCAGTLTLAQAQKEISFDWVQGYHKYVGQ